MWAQQNMSDAKHSPWAPRGLQGTSSRDRAQGAMRWAGQAEPWPCHHLQPPGVSHGNLDQGSVHPSWSNSTYLCNLMASLVVGRLYVGHRVCPVPPPSRAGGSGDPLPLLLLSAGMGSTSPRKPTGLIRAGTTHSLAFPLQLLTQPLIPLQLGDQRASLDIQPRGSSGQLGVAGTHLPDGLSQLPAALLSQARCHTIQELWLYVSGWKGSFWLPVQAMLRQPVTTWDGTNPTPHFPSTYCHTGAQQLAPLPIWLPHCLLLLHSCSALCRSGILRHLP